MIGFIGSFVLSFIAYLFLAANQGEILGLWSQNEIILAIIISLIVGVISGKVLFQKKHYTLLNPLKWVIFLVYLIGPFFYAMAENIP